MRTGLLISLVVLAGCEARVLNSERTDNYSSVDAPAAAPAPESSASVSDNTWYFHINCEYQTNLNPGVTYAFYLDSDRTEPIIRSSGAGSTGASVTGNLLRARKMNRGPHKIIFRVEAGEDPGPIRFHFTIGERGASQSTNTNYPTKLFVAERQYSTLTPTTREEFEIFVPDDFTP
jgi:hypothetical protein